MVVSKEAAIVPTSECGDLQPSKLTVNPTSTSPSQQVTQPRLVAADQPWKAPGRSGLLLELGSFHVVLSLLHVAFGIYLLCEVKNFHLMVVASWYPFWGAVSFFMSGTVTLTRNVFPKFYPSCLATNIISFLCALAGFLVIIKDLFLDGPFQSPIWRMYPNSMVHIQRIELGLLCFTFLEFFLPISAAIIAFREKPGLTQKEVLCLGTTPLDPLSPPTSSAIVSEGSDCAHPGTEAK
ncbi:membrane-spanning 4-domains subfamily A member 10 [Talpa occidentalis]|uniref:membrane-spanning 4-domains subfamily A member 10 n=1 Tax=Talpa occidentalis TaxID=50954 RepID=UPI00188F72A7|nr:membrane-spanning 4-domains subfamily A member 10 [Talpa occidentalis]